MTRFAWGRTITIALSASGALAFSVLSASTQELREQVDPMNVVPAKRAEILKENAGASERVLGGREAEKGEWPFQVALLATNRLDSNPSSQVNAQFCGGSLIAPQWVLTAAHCAVDAENHAYAPELFTVLVGATALNEGTRHRVAEIIVHQDYSPIVFDNDIALIKLVEPADQPTVTLVDPSGLEDSGKATVIGWGLMEDGTAPADLMEGDMGVYPRAACNQGIRGYFRDGIEKALRAQQPSMRIDESAIKYAMKVIEAGLGEPLTERMICAGTPTGEISSCYGDSGGPLLVTGEKGPVQIGVVSWGAGPLDASSACGHKDAYAVYARVASFRGWIKEKSGL